MCFISCSKINLGLQVLNKREEDGYHNLYSLFVELNLSDELYAQTRDFLQEKNGGPLYTSDQEIPTSTKMRTSDKIYSILKNNLKVYDLNKFEEFQKLINLKVLIP